MIKKIAEAGIAAFVFLLVLINMTQLDNVRAETITLLLQYDNGTHIYENNRITLILNGRQLTEMTVEPLMLNNRVYVAVRDVFEALGALVDWKAETRQAYIGYLNDLLILEIDNSIIWKNGIPIVMDTAPKIINERTMIPLRYAIEAFGLNVEWIGESSTVYIDEKKNMTTQGQETTVNPTLNPTSPPAHDGNATDISKYVFKDEQHAETKIIGIEIPSADSAAPFTITASSAISKVVKYLLEDNRLIIDIYNAEMSLPKTSYAVVGKSYLNTVRAGQNQTQPVKVTRIVFDITAAVEFSVSMSGDRKTINVSFEKNYIHNISTIIDNNNVEKIIIQSQSAPSEVSVFTLENPNRLVIDVPMCLMYTNLDLPVDGIFAKKIRTSQFDAETARVVVDLTQMCDYNVVFDGNSTVISLFRQVSDAVNYDANTHTIIIPKPVFNPFNISQLTEKDDYLNLKYTFTLPGDYAGAISHGSHNINDGYIRSFKIETVNGATKILIEENKILAFIVTEDINNIYIKAVLPKEKYDKIVVIDPGHGASALGTNHNGLLEKELNLNIALKLIALLETEGTVKVYSTRLTDTNPALAERADFANAIGDLFISIHNNSTLNGAGFARGTETLFHPHSNDAALGLSCEKVASIIQKNVVASINSTNRGYKYQDVLVLRETLIPAALVEVSYVDNVEDAALLRTDEYLQLAAEGVFHGILEIFSSYTPAR